MAEEHKEIDAVTGTATTGHEWDGLRELNTPLPRWWLWLFYITIVWSVGYWIVYPAWPLLTNSTQGVFGYHTRTALLEDLDALKQQRGPMMDKLAGASLAEIVADPQLLDFARAQGRVAFADNCAPCHGAGGGGAKGYPNLNDDEWLWGGKLSDIEQTIRFGARAGDNKGRAGSMPAFGRDKFPSPTKSRRSRILFVRSPVSPPNRVCDLGLGKKVYADNCAVCHGPEGKGNRGDGRSQSVRQDLVLQFRQGNHRSGIENGRGAVMPAWGGA